MTISNINIESCGLLITGNLYARKTDFNVCKIFSCIFVFYSNYLSDGFSLNYFSNLNSTLGYNLGVLIYGNMVFEDIVADSIILNFHYS